MGKYNFQAATSREFLCGSDSLLRRIDAPIAVATWYTIRTKEVCLSVSRV